MGYQHIKKVTKRRINFFLNPIRNYINIKEYRNKANYSFLYKYSRVKPNYIFYESRDGKSMTDNPYAIFKYILEHDLEKKYVHIWSVDSEKNLNFFKEKYKKHKNVRFVLRMTNKYFYYLTTCKYLFNNSTFPNLFTVKDEQVYINTWHGTPLKYMGFDIKGNPFATSNVLRNFLSADFILSPNQFTTNVFNNSFKLKDIYNGTIIEEGYPRIDLTVNANKHEIINELKSLNLKLEDKKIILYAPTWKGTDVAKPRNDLEQIYNDIKKIESQLGSDYNVLTKVHPFLYKEAETFDLLHEYLVPDTFETNELLSVVDILITDYSSIFFDFLVTRRPIIYYMWDYDDYKSNRGLYIDIEELPGPICTEINSVISNIKNIENVINIYNERYDIFVKQFCYHNYGNVTKKIVNTIFNNEHDLSSQQIHETTSKKEKILFYPGGFKNNGITTALINLLDNIDYEKYDITLIATINKNSEFLNNIQKLNDKVRLVFKIGRVNQTLFEDYRNYITKQRGLRNKFLKTIHPDKMYKREFQRIFGKTNFDYIIDYSGYSMFWANLLLSGKAKKKIIFMHSDLYSDMHKVINGRRPHFINLRGVFSLYPYFDELISVSEATMKLNKDNLKDYIQNTKIDYVNNAISPNKIIHLSQDDSDVFYKNDKPYLVSIRKYNNQADLVYTPFPESGDNTINFINLGRLSPEKGQDQLIEAFAKIHSKYENTRLYIVGEGVVREKLENLIQTLNLEDSVFLTGHLNNPFHLMNNCDAFILSSHYEGQPLVLFEALVLNLPVIATDIIANRDLLKNGKYGMLVENSIEGLVEGMEAVINKTYESTPFNPKAYNESAMKTFYDKLK